MKTPAIDIGRLKLSRIPHGGTRRLRTAVERELATLIAEKPLPKSPRPLRDVDARGLKPGIGADDMARQIAAQIHKELSK